MILRSNLPIISAIIAVVFCIIGVWLYYAPMEQAVVQPKNTLAVGLVSTDAEDEWREALVGKVHSAGLTREINITVIETERTQSAQMDAMRSLIGYNVDVIVFSPVMEKGWDYVIQEAGEAGIDIISLNEELFYQPAAEVENNVFYITYNYESLAYQVANRVSDYLEREDAAGLAAVELKGTIGSSVSGHISRGFRSALEEIDTFSMHYSTNASNLRSRGREVVGGILRTRHNRMDLIVAHNDGMALGALDAIRENGLIPGKDVLIVAFGGGPLLEEAYEKGEVLCVGYCDLNLMGEMVIDQCINLQSDNPLSRLTYGYSNVLLEA